MHEIDRKEQRRQQQRQDILEAAEAIFAQHGYHTATMDTVAEACGWSKGTLYLHFENKEDLFFSLLMDKLDRLSCSIAAATVDASSLEDMISTLISVELDFFKDHVNFFQLAVSEQGKVLQTSSTGMRERMLAQQTEFINHITADIQKHLAPESTIKADTLARTITGTLNVHMIAALMTPEAVDLDTLKFEIKDLFYHGVKQYEKA